MADETDAAESKLDHEIIDIGEIDDPQKGVKSHITKRREDIRSILAMVFLFMYLAIAATLVISSFYTDIVIIKEVAASVFAPLTGIVGSVIGFYFSSSSQKD